MPSFHYGRLISRMRLRLRSLVRRSCVEDEQETINLAVTLDWRLFAFTAAVALATCIVFGLAPAVRSSLVEPGAAVKSGGRSTSRRERYVLRRTLVAGQVTVSLMLLVFALLFIGIVAGLMLSLAAARSAASLLFGLSPHDVPTMLTATALLAISAGIAGYLPARRASKVDPMEALRCD